MESFAITIAKVRYTLRPTLAAAIALHRKHGIAKVLEGLAEWRWGILVDVVAECLPHVDAETREKLIGRLTKPAPHPSQVELFGRLALTLAGVDPSAEAPEHKEDKNAKPQDYSDVYRRLYQLGTGWLGWSPQVTLSSTPVEIIQAYEGRVDYLKAIYGTTEDSKPKDPSPQELDAKMAKALARWGAKKAA